MRAIGEAIVWVAFIAACLLCIGHPDILDGLIKRANNVTTQCEEGSRG